MKKVLVAGATVYLGCYLIKELKKQNYYVLALARNPDKLKDVRDLVDEVFEAEETKPQTLAGLCNEIDYVISSMGITRQRWSFFYGCR